MKYHPLRSVRGQFFISFYQAVLIIMAGFLLFIQKTQAIGNEEIQSKLFTQWNELINELNADDDRAQLQKQATQTLTELHTNSYAILPDSEQNRSTCVGAIQYTGEQAVVKMLEQNVINSATIIFITNLPVTPLCSKPQMANEACIDPQNMPSIAVEQSVKRRTESVRRAIEYAKENPEKLSLYFIYTEKGYEERMQSLQAKEIFTEIQNDVSKCSNIQFHMTNQIIDATLLNGASYLLSSTDNKHLLWSLTGKQAINAIDQDNQQCWKLWLGDIKQTATEDSPGKRWQAIHNCCETLGIQLNTIASE